MALSERQQNILKFIKYTMTSNSGEIWTLFLAPFLGLPIPLLPIHILWVNLITDSLPALGLGMDPGDEDVLKNPPRPPRGRSRARAGCGDREGCPGRRRRRARPDPAPRPRRRGP